MEKISIIVPVYNVEKYIEKCIDSIINQTFQNLEIILVDDGSKDSSPTICDNYEKKDSRIRVIHKENGGLSSARNAGIDLATGEYIGFIDPDDYIEHDMFEVLYDLIKKYDADLSVCGLIDCYGENVKRKITKDMATDKCVNKSEAIKIVMEAKESCVSAVNKLYKKEIFNDGLRYEEGKTFEDALIIIDVLMKCNKVAFTNVEGYYYIHRKNSITTKKFDEIHGYDVIYAYEKNYKLIENNFPELIDVAKMRMCWAYFVVLDSMIKSNHVIDKKVVKYLRKNIMVILKNDCFTKGRKFSAIALFINKNLYKVVLKQFLKRERKLYD